MTKTELIRAVSKKSGIIDSEAGKVVDAIILSVTLTLAWQQASPSSCPGSARLKCKRPMEDVCQITVNPAMIVST